MFQSPFLGLHHYLQDLLQARDSCKFSGEQIPVQYLQKYGVYFGVLIVQGQNVFEFLLACMDIFEYL